MSKKITDLEIKEFVENKGYKLLKIERKKDNKNRGYIEITIICPQGHESTVIYGNFKKSKNGCKYCYGNVKYTLQEVKEYFEQFEYELLSDEYKSNKHNLETVCPNGHNWITTFNRFKNGARCCYCENNIPLNIEYVKNELNKEGYELLSDEYKNNHTPLKIKCPNGHITEGTTWNNFKNGTRCSVCNNSKGEVEIEKWLKENNIEYVSQYKFEDCKGKSRSLPFDFYLPNYNVCIEYDGKQHYKIDCFNYTLLDLMNRKYLDNVKTKYCRDNNIKLIRIPYLEKNNLKDILRLELK